MKLVLALLCFSGISAAYADSIVVSVAQDLSRAGAARGPDYQNNEYAALNACGQSNCMVLLSREEGCVAVSQLNSVAYAASDDDIATAQQAVLNYAPGSELWFYACSDGRNNMQSNALGHATTIR